MSICICTLRNVRFLSASQAECTHRVLDVSFLYVAQSVAMRGVAITGVHHIHSDPVLFGAGFFFESRSRTTERCNLVL